MYIYKKDVGVITCYSSHVLRLSHCPTLSKRATRKPHTDMYMRHLVSYTSRHDQYNKGVQKHTHETFTVALFVTEFEFARFVYNQI